MVVLGSEGNGLSRLVREACDSIAGIPMSNMVESLNASVAAGITLYAVARARRGSGFRSQDNRYIFAIHTKKLKLFQLELLLFS